MVNLLLRVAPASRSIEPPDSHGLEIHNALPGLRQRLYIKARPAFREHDGAQRQRCPNLLVHFLPWNTVWTRKRVGVVRLRDYALHPLAADLDADPGSDVL